MFNLDSALTPSNLTIVPYDISAVGGYSTDIGANIINVAGGGQYDIVFDFPNASADRFTDNETLIYDFNYFGVLDPSSFNFFSYPGGGNGSYLTAAHIGGISDQRCSEADPACKSGWIAPGDGNTPIPEPGTLILLGSGLLGAAAYGRKKFKK
jgi:hypothetical protein